MNRQLLYALCFALMGLAYAMTPHIRYLGFFISAQGVTGFSAAGMDAAATIWPLEMFKDKVNPYLQAIHFSFALGNTFSPLISAPFLSPTREPLNLDGPDLWNATLQSTESLIYIPYTISATVLFCAGAVILILNYVHPYTVPESIVIEDDMVQSICVEYVGGLPDKTKSVRPVLTHNTVDRLRLADSLYLGSGSFTFSGRSKRIDLEKQSLLSNGRCNLTPGQKVHDPKDLPVWLNRLIIGLGAILLCCYCGVEMNSMNYLETFVVKGPLKLTKEKGALMTSVLAGAFTLGRGTSVYLATKISTITMLYFDVVLMMIGTLVIMVFGAISENYIWFGIVLQGFGFASVYPTTYAFLEQRVHITNTCTGVMLFVSSLIPAINPIIMGAFVDKYPMVFMWLNLFSASSCCLAFFGLHFTDRLRAKYVK